MSFVSNFFLVTVVALFLCLLKSDLLPYLLSNHDQYVSYEKCYVSFSTVYFSICYQSVYFSTVSLFYLFIQCHPHILQNIHMSCFRSHIRYRNRGSRKANAIYNGVQERWFQTRDQGFFVTLKDTTE